MLVPKLWCSLYAATISIVRDVITSCSEAFLILIHFRRRVVARFILWTRARISLAPDRVLWTASRFSLEFCIHENLPNLLPAGLTIRVLSVSANKSSATTAQLLGAFLCRLGLVLRPHSGKRQGDDDSN